MGTIGPLQLKNRIIMAPIDTNLADHHGRVTDELLAFYACRAAGGAAMTIVENSQVDYPIGKNTKRQLTIHSDEALPGLRQLSTCIHDNGALAAVQIHHAGRETTLEVTGGLEPVAPSAICCPHLQTPVRELTLKEIYQIIDQFTAAAVRGQEAGFDLVEMADDVALDVEPITQWDIKERLAKAGILIQNQTKAKFSDSGTIKLEGTNGSLQKLAADRIVWAGYRKSNWALAEKLSVMSIAKNLQVIGDARAVGTIHSAIHDGYTAIEALNRSVAQD